MSTVIRLAVWLLAWFCCVGPVVADEIRIAVASNFVPALNELATVFESGSGHRVLASAGSTGKLFAQIGSGAPFEVFLAADAVRPALLEQSGQAVGGSRFTYASGRIVLWSARPGLVDDAGRILSTGRFRRLAIANPDTSPYGAAASQTLQSMSVWNDVEPRLVRGENIAQAYHFVATGGAELGFVALSQIAPPDRSGVGSRWLVPEHMHAPIEQQAVLLTSGRDNSAAREFVAFLRTDAAKEIIVRHGYRPEP